MNLSRIYAIYIRQWFLIKSNPIRLASNFMWLLISMAQWGFISKYLDTLGKGTFNLVTVLLGAIILWEVTNRVQQGVMMGFLEDVWSRNFINYFASPLKMTEYMAGLVLISALTTVIGFGFMAAIAGFIFSYNIFKIGFMILPFLIILFVFGVTIGIQVTTVIFRYGPTAEWMAWPIPFVLSIVSGVFYPIATLPSPLLLIAKLTPSAYVFESLRIILAGGGFTTTVASNLAIGSTLTLVYLAISFRVFILTYHHNLKTGGIARFSAEQ